MEPTAILWPVAAQVFLFFGIAISLGLSRVRDVVSGKVDPQDSALDYDVWPEHSRQIANSYRNQLEMPLLFYLVCILALITRTVDHVFLYLAWAYVGLRAIHAAIHLTFNYVPLRALALLFSFIVLVALWLQFLVRVASASM